MTPIPARCPGCLRPRIPRHPAGMTWDHSLSCPLLPREDARRVADFDRLSDRQAPQSFTRPVTPTELTLLSAAGITLPPGAVTTVEAITPGVIRRTWPGASFDTPTTPTTAEDPS